MKLLVRSQNFRLQSDTEEFAQRKLEGLSRFLPNIREIRMELTRQENRRGEDTVIAQVTLTHERGAILRTEERANGFERTAIEAAITEALDKMYSRIKRFKGKREAARARGTAVKYSATLAEIEQSEDVPELAESEEVEPSVVVKRKHIPVGTMNEHEAIDQMELLGHTFFMYRDIATGGVNVVYKRRDGAYGVLAPSE
ncbi:MAG: HPF/RaiA family ribosome-associated protein [Chloroflexi bacterium]|nr:HPF/RaiA family ribosome-associated protein [Chloroflexota bacterium]